MTTRFCTMSEAAISSMVNAETAAWNARDADALVSLFHPDSVWPWSPSADAHDPMTWVMPFGRYNRERWKRSWQELFDTYELVYHYRKILRIAVSEDGDGGFAVVDVDTLWSNRESDEPPGGVAAGATGLRFSGARRCVTLSAVSFSRSMVWCRARADLRRVRLVAGSPHLRDLRRLLALCGRRWRGDG